MSEQNNDAVPALLRMRDAGWSVAVHNDYKLHGKAFTFWLFTRGVLFVKGEGRTDDDAIKEAETAARLFPADLGVLDIYRFQRDRKSLRRHALVEAIQCCNAVGRWGGTAGDCVAALESRLADEVAKNTP